MRLWTACRTIEGGWEFRGAETLNLDPQGAQPVRLASAPFVDYQFSAIMVEDILSPLAEDVLRQMRSMIHKKKPENWFAIFLASYILLHSYGLLMKQQRDFSARRQNKVSGTV